MIWCGEVLWCGVRNREVCGEELSGVVQCSVVKIDECVAKSGRVDCNVCCSVLL